MQGTQGFKEAEAALEKQLQMLQTMLDTTHAQLAYLDREFNFLAVNAAYAKGSGYTREELLGRNHFDLFPHGENQVIFARVRDTGEPVAFEARPFVYPNRPELGTTYWDWTLRPVTNERGVVEGLLLSLVDVTEQRHTQRRLERYANHLRHLHETDTAILEAETIEQIAAAALEHLAGVMSLCSACVALFDWEPKQARLIAAIPQACATLAPGSSMPLESFWCLDALSQGRTYRVEDLADLDLSSPWLEALRAEGVRTFLSLPLTAQGDLIGCLNLGWPACSTPGPEEDEIISEIARHLAIALRQARLEDEVRRHAEKLEAMVSQRTARLRASEGRFRSMFEEAPVGIALTDVRGRIHTTNPALQQILRYTADELAGKALSELVDPDDTHQDEPLPAGLVSGRLRRYRAERRFLRKDGRSVWVSLTACPVSRSRGRPRSMMVMLEDITDQREAAGALLRAEKLAVAGRLAASLTHEINNPLQSVMGCLGLAREALAEGENADRFLEVALEELRRAAAIVSRLRDMQRRSPRESREPADVNALLEQVLTLTAKKCADHQVDVHWRPDPTLPLLPVVPDHIRQVFLNVVLNAVEAMPEGGRLQVRAVPTAGPAGLAVTIADTGVGMAPEALERLFEPFYSTKRDGLGLGLHVSRNIVRDHGGRIEVASNRGSGTTVTIWLPAR